MANRIFSGIRTSGQVHLGNYLGAVKNWVSMQNDPDTELIVFGLMDYHAITTPYDPKLLKKQVLNTALDFLASGVDPNKALLIRQSRVSQHTELAWLFNTITPISWLERLPTYKEKKEQTGGKYNHMGILDYPILMAADILIYKANNVPVGEDQRAHIDITNEIAKKFNSMFGETFETVRVPKFAGARIMSLQDPTKKMSKTGDESIGLSDTPDKISKKIKKAVTDSGSEIIYEPSTKPAVSNLLTVYHLLSGRSIDSIVESYSNKGYADFKIDLTQVVIDFLKPFQAKRKELESDIGQLERTLTASEERAINIATETMTTVKARMGF